MAAKWTLHIEDFEKIKVADLKMFPFVGIVGENNTGKSYLMSLIWGLITISHPYAFYQNSSEYVACINIIKRCKEQDIVLNDEEQRVFVDLYNYILKTNKMFLLKTIFNYPVEAGLIEIRDFSTDVPFVLHAISSPTEISDSIIKRQPTDFPIFYVNKDSLEDEFEMGVLIESVVKEVLFINANIHGYFMKDNSIYLPASRTGFMLTYPQLVGQSLETFYSLEIDNKVESSLTRPYISFLQFITHYRANTKLNTQERSLVSFIEKELTNGKIIASKDKMPEFKYRIAGMKEEIPFHISSSVVTEVAPLLMALNDKRRYDSFFIEEPEAHLHPGLQQKMAQLLIRLANTGKMVFITTHSDTIIQHINNMIMLKKSNNAKKLMKQYGYKKEDLLDMNNINLYQFKQEEDGRSILIPLEKTDYGFVVPTFNDSLSKLLDETSAFQGE